jgi:uncharacterized protein
MQAMHNASVPERRSTLAFLYSIPIAILGGLIGLGGAEFRLPVLAGRLGYPTRKAIPINLAVSFITLFASLIIRNRALSLTPVVPFRYAVCAMIAGAIVAAFFGTQLTGKLSDEKLEQVILVLLVAIGLLLVIEGFLPEQVPAFLPADEMWHIGAGIVFGLLIGLVSSLLGVAGGELIIPTLVFAFGADIKTAGTASLIISLPTVFVGGVRYAMRGAFDNRKDVTGTVTPMGLGSIIGSFIGGLLVGIISTSVLKVTLGIILNVSAWRIFQHHRTSTPPNTPV